jgi:hypothetical protein
MPKSGRWLDGSLPISIRATITMFSITDGLRPVLVRMGTVSKPGKLSCDRSCNGTTTRSEHQSPPTYLPLKFASTVWLSSTQRVPAKASFLSPRQHNPVRPRLDPPRATQRTRPRMLARASGYHHHHAHRAPVPQGVAGRAERHAPGTRIMPLTSFGSQLDNSWTFLRLFWRISAHRRP